jgi:hypothetical protein
MTASEVMERLREHIGFIPDEPAQTVDLRRGREVMCGDCGVSISIFDRCQWCDGHAVPAQRIIR